uniref:Uncharacterized protein n=1 Tax=Setaria italica TaxID=4555 RepID=K3ZJU0_SETIT
MDNVVSIYHEGTVERDDYGCVKFVNMQSMVVLLIEKPSFSELVASAREELYCHEDDDITVEGVLHLGSPFNIQRKMIPIWCADKWENDVRSVMKRHVGIMNDSDAYEMGMYLDSDNDRPVGEMTESDVEMFRRCFPDRRDPRVHEFSDLSHSNHACAEGSDDELLEAPEAGPSIVIEEGSALMRWLQAFAVIKKRPYKVLHSYAEHRYTVVCDK